MIKKISLILSVILLWVSVSVAQQKQKPKVDYRSDITNVINQGELIKLSGNVAFHHNGAIITCDTAYMYKDSIFEGIGNVIINSDSTYIYGDKFTYDEKENLARVFAPIIKTVDKDAILYTHNMEFNTLTSVGSYYGGGTMTQNDNLMESKRGDYYTKTRDMIFTGKVEMKNDDYTLKTDSVGFNLSTEYVTFFTKTHIWNDQNEYLEANKGSYDRKLELYTFTDNAYLLSKEQEVWADSIKYWSTLSESELRKNIQIIDTTQKVMVFGNYGHYWGKLKKVIMTDNPSALSYNPEIATDSTFLRADTLLVFPAVSPLKDSVKTSKTTLDSIGVEHNFDNLMFSDSTIHKSTMEDSSFLKNEVRDSIFKSRTNHKPITDSLHIHDENCEHEHNHEKGHKHSHIVEYEMSQEQIDKILQKEAKKEAKRKAKELKQKEKAAKRAKRGSGWLKPVVQDTTPLAIDSSKLKNAIDSTAIDSLNKEKITPKPVADSSDYIIKGINSVSIYKNDIQAVCDTIISISVDSTLHFNNNAIIWNENNQITAQKVVLFSKNEVAERAELYDFPIIAQKIGIDKFNQVRGKFMEIFFKNNEIDIAYIDGNAQTVFYQEEDEEPVSIFNATSSSMEIQFDSSQIARIKWVNDVIYDIFPLDKKTSETLETLEGFKWDAEKRPLSRQDVCNEVIKDSRREAAEKIERPSFSLTKTIDEEKVKFSKEGTWSDRNELIQFTVDDIVLKFE